MHINTNNQVGKFRYVVVKTTKVEMKNITKGMGKGLLSKYTKAVK